MPTQLRVLIVEDSENDALLILRELRRGGYEPTHERVETVEAMKAALAKESWDVVISDYSMPQFSGPVALEVLKASGIDLPFIIVSGTIGEETAVAALKAGAHDFIVKGNLPRLIPAIEREMREVEVRRKRREAEKQLHHQLQRLAALRAIDMAITASLDLRVTLNVILDQVTSQLRVDASDVLLLNPHSQMLEYIVGRGFRSDALTHTRLRLSRGYAGQAALERRIVHVPNLLEEPGEFTQSPSLPSEEFIAYFAAPLIAKGQIRGVVEVFHRAALVPDHQWLDFLEALAGQAAIALDNASLFDDLQRSHIELTVAYENTLEGWVKALDLRDKETEGHTHRVTDLTVRLARAMGMSEAELVHVQRGALLHDIGKLGIPDSILLKPGPLTDEEWVIMRKHTVYAYEWLSPIAYLRPALGIPYCHHEKWDSTGYPRGLKGDLIPLEARAFAVVDVWDALISDRPYRPAWAKEKTLEHIRAGTGAHFDPQVVEVFLGIADL